VTDALRDRVRGAALLLFDGTLWRDDEIVRAGVGQKTGRRMGHISISGPEGAVAAWEGVSVGRKLFIHLNNTNPVLVDGSAERDAVAAAGWELAEDGMELVI
jgi:pyrroloquinoline quinone biosynthesis protein B